MTYVPPAAQAAIKALADLGYSVAVRSNANGSNRYSVNGARETDALTMIKRFDAGKFPVVLQFVDVSHETAYGSTVRLSKNIRVF